MPQKISPDIMRTCKVCGVVFHPTSRKQECCNRLKTVNCLICGKEMEVKCTTGYVKKTCSRECGLMYSKQLKSESEISVTRKCKWCGKEFTPTTSRNVYCDGPHYQTCAVCGKQFQIDLTTHPEVKTCSKECKNALSLQNRDIAKEQEHLKRTLLDKYGVDNAMRIEGTKDKLKQTNLEKYGSEWYTQTQEYKDNVKQTSLEKYGVEHHLQSAEVIAKRTATVNAKYGVDNVAQSAEVKQSIRSSLIQKYGVINPSQYPEFKAKATASAKMSTFEARVKALFDNYHIEYKHHYIMKVENYSHEFDFYLPKYKFLIDCDGLYYHGYLDDADGERVRTDYDEIRLQLVPNDYIFHVIVEGQEEKDIKYIVNILSQIDNNVFEYENELFNWCRSISFPYPEYSHERMKKDYKHLCNYNNVKYSPSATLGLSAIEHYHHSIYDANVHGCCSPVEGWNNDDKLKQVIRNRLIYKNDVDPHKILRGFNISKICPRISIFNPVLARYLTLKYLADYDTVFDPFSGYSGRLLGVSSTGKKYIGHDLNAQAIQESDQIILELDLDNAEVKLQDILTDDNTDYECILTCPPYNNKEHYNAETTCKTCDEWIDLIINKYTCSRYVFVVDSTTKYSNNIREIIKSTSHLSKVQEYVVVIDGDAKV